MLEFVDVHPIPNVEPDKIRGTLHGDPMDGLPDCEAMQNFALASGIAGPDDSKAAMYRKIARWIVEYQVVGAVFYPFSKPTFRVLAH